MSEKKSATLDAANIEGGKKQAVFTIGDLPQIDTTIEQEARQDFPIASILPVGAENAIPSARLVEMIDCGTVRKLQSLIAKEREAGALILSTTTGGYFMPDTGQKGREEIAAFVAVLHARAVNTLKAVKAARAALAVMDGQSEMEGL